MLFTSVLCALVITAPAAAPWAQTTPEGVGIELVAISTLEGGKMVSWTPEGIRTEPRHPWLGDDSEQGVKKYQIAFQIKSLEGLAVSLNHSVPGVIGTSYSSGSVVWNDRILTDEAEINSETNGLRILHVTALPNAKRINVKSGLAGGAFRTIHEQLGLMASGSASVFAKGIERNISFTRAFMDEKGFGLAVVENYLDHDVQYEYESMSGAIKPVIMTSSSVEKTYRLTDIRVGDIQAKDVKALRAKARAFHYVEFKNVPLAPKN